MILPIHKIIPEDDILLQYDPEELAGVLLQCINELPVHFSGRDADGQVNPAALFGRSNPEPYHKFSQVQRAVMEAWNCLVRDGFVAPHPEKSQHGWFFITRKGIQVQGGKSFEAFQHAARLPKELLHPTLQLKIYPDFATGDYDTAVFKAFKEVEVAVRRAGGFGLTDLGVELMRKAFKEGTGPLSDTSLPISEQQALAHLFAGAIGSYKNPGSHRHVSLSDPRDAVELIFLASHLLRLIESRGAGSPISP